MSGLHGNAEGGEAVVVLGVDVGVRLSHEILDNVHGAVLGGAHERGAAVLVPVVDVCPRQHEGGLAVLAGAHIKVDLGKELLDDGPVGVTGDDGEGDEHGAGVASLVQDFDVGVGHLGVQEDGHHVEVAV